MKQRNAIAAILAVCAVAAGAVGVAQGSSTKSTTRKATTQTASTRPAGGAPPGGGMGIGGRSVHAVSVVLDKAGSGYIEQTSDRGTVQSVDPSAGTITIVEGTKTVTYKTLTLNIDSDATVTLDGKTSALSALAAGDQVSVTSSADGTSVFATDSSYHPTGGGPGQGGPPPSGASAYSPSAEQTAAAG